MIYLRARDSAAAAHSDHIDRRTVRRALDHQGLDARGLGPIHRRILELLHARGRPVASSRLALLAGISVRALRAIFEPDLLRHDLVRVTARGIALGPPA